MTDRIKQLELYATPDSDTVWCVDGTGKLDLPMESLDRTEVLLLKDISGNKRTRCVMPAWFNQWRDFYSDIWLDTATFLPLLETDLWKRFCDNKKFFMEMNCPKEFVNIPDRIIDHLIQCEFNYMHDTDLYRWVMDHRFDPDIENQFDGRLHEESDAFFNNWPSPKSSTSIHQLIRYVRTQMVKELLDEDARNDLRRLHQYAVLKYGASRPSILFVDGSDVTRSELCRLTQVLWYCLRRIP